MRPTLGTGNTINHNNKTSSNNTDNNSSNAIIITIIIIIIDIMYNISIITVCGLSPSPQRGIKKGDPINNSPERMFHGTSQHLKVDCDIIS